MLVIDDRFPEIRGRIADGLQDFRQPLLFRNTPMHTLLRTVTAMKSKERGIPNRLAELLAHSHQSWREKRLLDRLQA